MINVSNDLKTLTKKIKQQNCKITLLEEDRDITIKEVKYGFEGNLFKTIMKQIVITIPIINDSLKGKSLNFEYGLYINNQFEYIDLGDFYIKDEPEADKGAEQVEITAYDKLVHFMKTFKQSELQLTYPCTMLKLIQRMCEVCGVELYSTDFYHANLNVNEDYFTTQEITYRDVLEKVAEATFTTIYIKNNKLYLSPISTAPIEMLDRSYLSKLVITDKFGPVNALVLGRGDVEDNVEARDDISISQNSRCEIRFDENEFLEYQREQVINEMFEKIKGLTYYSFEASDVGIMWLEPNDCISLKNDNNDIYNSYYLEANITINTGIKSDIEAKIPEETETEYKVTTEEEKRTLKVERLAKKNEGLIQDIIEEQTEFSSKLTKVEQTVDGISQKVQDIEDVTRKAQGISIVTLENCIANNLLELHIYGNNSVFKYLYPANDLYPADDLYPIGDSIIIVTDNDGNSIEYDLGITEVLRQNGLIYDEYILIEGQAKIIRRINGDGSIKDIPTEENLGQLIIPLSKNTNTIEIKNYIANIEVKYAIKNDYTDIFATKVEMDSSIEQSAQEIDLSVNKKLQAYSTTEEMNANIKITADWINSEVSKKVGNDEIISKINQSAEKISIDASKISLEGKQINLTSDNIIIESDNFSVDKNGNMTCKGATFEGGKLEYYTADGTLLARQLSDTINYEGVQVKALTLVIQKSSTPTYNIRTDNGISILEINSIARSEVEGSSGSADSGYVRIRDVLEAFNIKTSYLIASGTSITVKNQLIVEDNVYANNFINRSEEKIKKNITKLKNNKAIDLINKTDVCEFNYTNDKQKTIGLVLGDKFNVPEEIIKTTNNKYGEQIKGIDLYSMISLAWKAIQEQQREIEKQNITINNLQNIIQDLSKRLEKLEKEEK